LAAGTYQVSNGAGGTGVGPFKLSLKLAAALTWTNQSIADTVIDRSKPLTLTWAGGDPGASVQISISTASVNLAAATATGASVSCAAPVSAGQFTVPPYVLLSLIPGASSNGLSLAVFDYEPIALPGFDYATAVTASLTGVSSSAGFR
jgi:hypothetical protein